MRSPGRDSRVEYLTSCQCFTTSASVQPTVFAHSSYVVSNQFLSAPSCARRMERRSYQLDISRNTVPFIHSLQVVRILLSLSNRLQAYKGNVVSFAPLQTMSLISTEPQSRAALEGHSNSLISQFDTQLEIIVDRYLSFFQERSVGVAFASCSTLIHQFSGEALRKHSQFSKEIL